MWRVKNKAFGLISIISKFVENVVSMKTNKSYTLNYFYFRTKNWKKECLIGPKLNQEAEVVC